MSEYERLKKEYAALLEQQKQSSNKLEKKEIQLVLDEIEDEIETIELRENIWS